MSNPDFSDLNEPEKTLAEGLYELDSSDGEPGADRGGLTDELKEKLKDDDEKNGTTTLADAEAKIAESEAKGKKQTEDRARGMAKLIEEYLRLKLDSDGA